MSTLQHQVHNKIQHDKAWKEMCITVMASQTAVCADVHIYWFWVFILDQWTLYIYIYISGTITFSHLIVKKMKPRYQSFTRIGRQSQSLKRQVYTDWTSVSFPLCKPLRGQYKFERNHEKTFKKHRQHNAIHCRSKLFCS
jgi:hypothetical protein